jgi:hypothetical protein
VISSAIPGSRRLGTVSELTLHTMSIMNTNLLAAYSRLGIKPRDVERSMQITPQLEQIYHQLKQVQHSLILNAQEPSESFPDDTYYYLRASDSEDAKKVLLSYYSIPKFLRKELPIEAFCLHAGVPALRILEIVTSVCVRIGATASTVIAALAHPRVVESTIQSAMLPGAEGHADRQDLHKATGFLPTPKGNKTQININQSANASAESNVAQQFVSAPPPEQTIRRMVDRFNDHQSANRTHAPLPEPQPGNLEGLPSFPVREAVPAQIPTDEDGYEE